MFDRIRRYAGRFRGVEGTDVPERRASRERRAHNLFEAAAVYVAARAEDDQERMEEAAGWVSPEALSFGVSELACRAVITLARERDESPATVARDLLGLPVA
ncbi:hypothetical protein ACFWPQ_02580 [Streptomyces sp. NPDC058464]|uniref:hypothetical protein n=1 Tax=Streptomyces sp. NPDC058464 TaxID=3346511 RepID=UPI0036481269